VLGQQCRCTIGNSSCYSGAEIEVCQGKETQ
jgi:hypothetical protein